MKLIRMISILIVLAVLGSWVTVRLLTVDIPAGQVGVRVQQYAILGSKGVVKKDFTPGYHRNLGPIDTWLFFDSTVQTLEMTQERGRGDRPGRDDVRVISADGNEVSVDVTVKYQIMDGKAHLLYQDTGGGTKYKAIVRTEAERACMALFGQMQTEDFYNPQVRREKAAEAKKLLVENLADNYVEVIDVLVRNVQFDTEYERKIRRKKQADQEVELNKSEGLAATQRGLREKIEAETEKLLNIIRQERESELKVMEAEADREIATIRAEAERYATQKRADADLVRVQKESEGNLLMKKAEAEGERLRNAAMQGAGGSIIVALEAAKNLNVGEVDVSTLQVDLLDVDGMATRLGVPEED